MLNLFGSPDRSSAVDYTVNCAVGIPFSTGPAHSDASHPVNHPLPAWDAITGVTSALELVTAERHRRLTGEGQLIKIALSDVAMAMVGNLGYIAEAELMHEDRPAFGNYLYGSYGRDFETRDRRLIYIVAITDRMWTELGRVTGLADRFAMIEPLLGLDLKEEGDRFRARDVIWRSWTPGYRRDPSTRSRRRSPVPACAGVLTRPSARCCAKTRAARPPIRSSMRSISPALGAIW